MRYYTVAEIAKIFKVDVETVRRWLRSGELLGNANSKKNGYRVSETDLIRFASRKPKRKMQLYSSTGLKATIQHSEQYEKIKNKISQLTHERDALSVYIDTLELLLKTWKRVLKRALFFFGCDRLCEALRASRSG